MSSGYQSLLRAATIGDLPEVMRIVRACSLTASDIGRNESEILYAACSNGHGCIVMWLISHLGIVHDHIGIVFADACRAGNHDLAAWLMEKCEPSTSDVCNGYMAAAAKGHQRLCQWLASHCMPANCHYFCNRMRLVQN